MIKINPQLSIIIPAYNAGLYIKECLDSLLAQAGPSFEIIVINDGSSDQTQDILDQYTSKFPQITSYFQENSGQASARNKGLGLARGDYIYFVDSDDKLRPGSLEEIFSRIKNYPMPIDVIYFDGEVFYDGKFEGEGTFKTDTYYRSKEYGLVKSGQDLFNQMYPNKDYKPSPCLYVFSKALADKHQLQFGEGYIHEDEFFSFLVIYYAQTCLHINENFYQRRVRPDSTMTSSQVAQRVDGYTKQLEDFWNFSQNNPTQKINKNFKAKLKSLYLSSLKLLYSEEELDRNRLKKLRKVIKKFNYVDWKTLAKDIYYTLTYKLKN